MPNPRGLSFDPVLAAREVWSAKGWGEAATGMAAVASIMRAHQLLLAKANDVLRPFDLTFARYEVLAWLAWSSECGSLSLSQIAERLQVTPATVTNSIDRLEADKLVRRLPHPHDARTTLAEITARGRRTVTAATDDLNNKVYEAVGMSQSEMESLIRVLEKVRVGHGDLKWARARNGATATS